MAKKSAKSKGFRRQTEKKPYLSKRDIITLCVILAVVIVGAVLLFRYDDGALKVQDGAVVTEGDNWLIVNGAPARSGARYFKLGEIGEIDGYAREKSASATDDINIPHYAFTPQAEGAAIGKIEVTASHNTAETLCKYVAGAVAAMDGYETTDPVGGEFGGQACQTFIAERSYVQSDEAEDADAHDGDEPAEEAEPNRFGKTLYAYFDAPHDSCIVVHVEAEADAKDALPDDDALAEALSQAVAAVTLEAGK